MIRGNAISELVDLLVRRQTSLWHACNLQDFRAYLALGGVPSRAALEASGLAYTGFTTDVADRANGVWDKVFVNFSDFGEGFAHGSHAVPNPYGPIVLQISSKALLEANDVAICLHSAGARNFNREAEALSNVELVDDLFYLPVGSEFPSSTKVRYGQNLLEAFPQAKSSNPEISCTFPSGSISLSHVIVIWTDPYVIVGKSLRDWGEQALQGSGFDLRIRERSCRNDSRRKMYAELAELVHQGIRSLTMIEQLESASDEMVAWAAETLKNGIDYNFQRYADYLFNGTLVPLNSGRIAVMPSPKGSYADKFRRLMALKRQPSPEAIGEIVAALSDEDENIRWLAGSTLLVLDAAPAMGALRTFATRTHSDVGREAAREWLNRIERSEAASV